MALAAIVERVRGFDAARLEAVATLDPAEILALDEADRPVAAPEEQDLDDVHHDTDDLALLRAGITLFRRDGGTDPGWHVRLPVAADRLGAVHLPARQDAVPAELAGLVRAVTGGRALSPVAELRTLRRTWRVPGPRHGPRTALVVDAVAGWTLGPDDEVVLSWTEVVLRSDGSESVEHLDRAEERLAAWGLARRAGGPTVGRLLAGRVRAGRGTAGQGPAVRGRRDPGPATVDAGSAAAPVLAFLAAQVAALRRHDPLARLDREDAVRRMRVAARRARSVLRSSRRVLDREATAPLVRELRWLAGELAPARDTEVMAARLGARLDELPDELVVGPVRAELTRAFSRRTVTARERALTALDSGRHLALLAAFDALLADPPLAAKAARPAAKELGRALVREQRRAAAARAAVDTAEPGAERDEALHEARKAAKRARYLAEAAVPVLGKRARELRRRMKATQRLLGDHQDTVVTRETLRALAADEVTHGFTLGVVHAAEAARAAEIETGLFRAKGTIAR